MPQAPWRLGQGIPTPLNFGSQRGVLNGWNLNREVQWGLPLHTLV